jgi:hypothetical protein
MVVDGLLPSSSGSCCQRLYYRHQSYCPCRLLLLTSCSLQTLGSNWQLSATHRMVQQVTCHVSSTGNGIICHHLLMTHVTTPAECCFQMACHVVSALRPA